MLKLMCSKILPDMLYHWQCIVAEDVSGWRCVVCRDSSIYVCIYNLELRISSAGGRVCGWRRWRVEDKRLKGYVFYLLPKMVGRRRWCVSGYVFCTGISFVCVICVCIYNIEHRYLLYVCDMHLISQLHRLYIIFISIYNKYHLINIKYISISHFIDD